MTRGERRKRRKRKIKQRMNLAAAINHCIGYSDAQLVDEPGYFANNNEMNVWAGSGRAKKTKVKYGHASYRHKGGEGATLVYGGQFVFIMLCSRPRTMSYI